MHPKTTLSRALALAFGGALFFFSALPSAQAQSNTTGSIHGSVGRQADVLVQIENLATGVTRRVAVDASGRYQAGALQPGRYKVSLVRGDSVLRSAEVEVQLGQGSAVDLVEALAVVEVTGRRKLIDVANTDNGATFSARQLEALPVARNLAAIIQLAPNTTSADPRYSRGNGASFGGGAATENAYYINGFPVTSAWAQFGSSELPFGAIDQAQVLTGGFGAEFGRSIGGVVNLITKSGGNRWEGGASASITPNKLRGSNRDLMYPVSGKPEGATTDGTLFQRRSDRSQTDTSLAAYVGGPLVKDRLFMFLAVEQNKSDIGEARMTRPTLPPPNVAHDTYGWRDATDTTKRYLGKFDWAVSEAQRLELTLVGDQATRSEELRGYNYATGAVGNAVNARFNYRNYDTVTPVGADAQILKYTAYLSDDLTLTALHGRSKSKHSLSAPDRDVYDTLSGLAVISASAAVVPSGLSPQNRSPFLTSDSITPRGAEDRVKSTRLDLEYRLGEHTLRGGIDDNTIEAVNNGRIRPGGGIWTYSRSLLDPRTPVPMSRGTPVAPASGGGYGLQGYYVQLSRFETTTNAGSEQSAVYLEDKWQFSRQLLLTGGIRHEAFRHSNGDGQEFLNIKHQWQPRLAAAWDVNGDASFKLFGSAGRYAVQTPNQLSERHASRSFNTRQFYTYTGVDAATGAPTGLVALTGPRSPNNELGQAKDPRTLVATDLKPSYQDELTLGFEKAWTPKVNVGARLTYRKLRSVIDDLCDTRPFDDWAARNNVTISNHFYSTFSCVVFNPGKGNTFSMDLEGPGVYREIKLSAADYLNSNGVAFPKAKRSYAALDVFAEHPLRDGWFGRINYTYARNRGNTEGQTNSDVGQTDVGKTQTWDFPEQMLNTFGPLPNERKHQFKAFGYLELGSQWGVGANLLLASGRPKNCTGDAPAALDPYGYNPGLFFCDGKAAPRGSRGHLAMEQRVDLNLQFKPEQVKGLNLRVDLFNAFNRQSAQAIDEIYEDGAGGYSPRYGRVLSYTNPRAVKFTVSYERPF